MRKKLKAVLFDMDGVLFNSMPPCVLRAYMLLPGSDQGREFS